MKKNVMMRVASIMLVLVLMSSSVISGTFAKYVTSGESKDTARVAKFGVSVTGYSDMFKTAYEKHDNTFNKADVTVESSTADKLVAPGTNKTLTGFAVTGTPEVAVRVSYKVDTFTMENWKVDLNKDGTMDGEYCPIVFTITKNGTATNYYIGDGTATDVNSLITEVADAINNYTQDYAAKTTLDGALNDDLVISWRWYFDKNVEGNPLAGYQEDVADTSLGDLAVSGTAATIDLKVTCTITQID